MFPSTVRLGIEVSYLLRWLGIHSIKYQGIVIFRSNSGQTCEMPASYTWSRPGSVMRLVHLDMISCSLACVLIRFRSWGEKSRTQFSVGGDLGISGFCNHFNRCQENTQCEHLPAFHVETYLALFRVFQLKTVESQDTEPIGIASRAEQEWFELVWMKYHYASWISIVTEAISRKWTAVKVLFPMNEKSRQSKIGNDWTQWLEFIPNKRELVILASKERQQMIMFATFYDVSFMCNHPNPEKSQI